VNDGPKDSFGQMLEKLQALDDDMLPEEFDPAVLIGDIKDKVDAIKWKLNHWEYRAKMIKEEFIAPLQAKAESLKKKHERLTKYVFDEMQRMGVEKIPGNAFRIQIQNSQKVFVEKEPADAKMYLNYQDLVIQETTYKWRKDEIKSLIEEGHFFTFAELRTPKHARFWPIGEKIK